MTIKTFIFSPFQENTYLVYDETNKRAWAYWLENNANARVTGANIITVEQLIQNIKAVDGIDITFKI